MIKIDFVQIWTNLVLFLPRLGTALLILIAFWLLSVIIRGVIGRFGENRRLSRDLVHLMEQIIDVSLVLFGVVTALGTLGIDAGAMIAGLGLVGFALGFALKDLLANFLSGLLILIYTPFTTGDDIDVVGNAGKVVEVNLRYTVLQTEGKQILIPNQTLFSNPVIVQRNAIRGTANGHVETTDTPSTK